MTKTDVKNIVILRSSVVTPLVNKDALRDFYWNNFSSAFDRAIKKILESEEV